MSLNSHSAHHCTQKIFYMLQTEELDGEVKKHEVVDLKEAKWLHSVALVVSYVGQTCSMKPSARGSGGCCWASMSLLTWVTELFTAKAVWSVDASGGGGGDLDLDVKNLEVSCF